MNEFITLEGTDSMESVSSRFTFFETERVFLSEVGLGMMASGRSSSGRARVFLSLLWIDFWRSFSGRTPQSRRLGFSEQASARANGIPSLRMVR
jgi:hypothetical protein